MKKTKIEWTETTWNPITGCTKHSAGCLNCYAERMAKPLQAMGAAAYIRDTCIKTKTPFFFKQWGGVRKKENGRMLEGRI